ncbi:hypothetical protein [Bacteroides ovatus]|uniref:hypothetical protein n=1 Tax=Bacteroides ovatus TaxID=28116 RepID=UPI002166161F|nr:hypothetical protein [Bacteroides ovatus]MCS3242752.1 hypothetical protein [Bacteroides ovatus]
MVTGRYYGADIQTKVANNYDPEAKYGNTNWTKEVFKDYGFTHQHNISASGGNKNIRFFTSIRHVGSIRYHRKCEL